MANIDMNNFTAAEIAVMVAAINYCGYGEHPVASEGSLWCFNPVYVRSCLCRAIERILNPAGQNVAATILARLQ